MNISINLQSLFGVPKHILLKMINETCKRPLTIFTNLNFRLFQQKIRKMTKKRDKLQHFCLENS